MNITKVKFQSELSCKRTKNNKTEIWTLTEDFIYTLYYKSKEERDHSIPFKVPKNFESDGASVPRPLWSIYPPWGIYAESAVVHDYHYRVPNPFTTRKKADYIFLLGMKELGVSIISRRIIYTMVRIFGYFTWKKYRKSK